MNTYIRKNVLLKITAFLALSSGSLYGLTAEERGLQIAEEMDRRDSGFGDTSAELLMELRNKQGETSSREMSMRTLEGIGEGDKSLIVFDEPRDVKGTAFLSYTKKVGPDDQWLFLPALERVKRISSSNKSGPFVGSEFAYEDLSSQEVEKYTYRYLRDEDLDGEPCFVVERYPVDPKSGYTRQIVWVDQSEYISRKMVFYDRKDSLLKTLTFSKYRQYDGRYWRSHQMTMVNHQTGKATTLEWKDYQFGNGYSERDFDRRSLQTTR
ncbi:outer membrane lipoprotein-sorting protein [Pelagicoccus sp. SDUM812003]|uniref:outer membrane lipoprotein-sorting protein n=1 Tax=Pelagicoccus sp. SDUM812003 TaxID=3041267 RepID=UPI00280F2529|nr:outer membrane lipoprotein-sorting protein [Pelagicoccus sp. SDUM812003]MDQ8202431.1 outer membrane lipoprotein-sorting protein [Pelagicoccus sp. SDUM812003]